MIHSEVVIWSMNWSENIKTNSTLSLHSISIMYLYREVITFVIILLTFYNLFNFVRGNLYAWTIIMNVETRTHKHNTGHTIDITFTANLPDSVILGLERSVKYSYIQFEPIKIAIFRNMYKCPIYSKTGLIIWGWHFDLNRACFNIPLQHTNSQQTDTSRAAKLNEENTHIL